MLAMPPARQGATTPDKHHADLGGPGPATPRPAAIVRARDAIDAAFLDTPQYLSGGLSRRAGCHVVVKVETVNPVRSFKGRGCDALLATCDPNTPLVAASAGNFGLGLAHGAARSGHDVTVVAATTARPGKVRQIRELGATVVESGDDFDAAKAHARELAARTGARFVEDGHEPAVAAGAATIAMELDAWPGALRRAYVPVGNGALIIGMGSYLRPRRDDGLEIIGVVAEGAPAMLRSWRRGAPVATPTVDTQADGIAVRVPVPAAVQGMARTVDRMLAVSDAQIGDAMRACWEDLGLLPEPAGAAGVAGLLADAHRPDDTAAVILTGSNLEDDAAASVIAPRA